MAAVIGMRGLRKPRADPPPPVVKYHVRFEALCEEEYTVEAVRSRMGLLNEAMRRAIIGSENFEATHVDYVAGVLELNVWTRQLQGIREASVAVSVERVGSGAA
jgi:hypothetical protein